MELTDDTFRALARSSPWRWRTLHFTRTDTSRKGTVGVREAWYRRPDALMVRRGNEVQTHRQPDRRAVSRPAEPVMRPDGLVAEREQGWILGIDDLIDDNYTWVALLDPCEASAGVTISDLRAGRHHGREAWFARVVPDEGDGQGYEPRCAGCCDLFPNRLTDEVEAANGGFSPKDPRHYPDAFDVVLDVETGVMVLVVPVVGSDLYEAWDIEIHQVDPDLTDLLV